MNRTEKGHKATPKQPPRAQAEADCEKVATVLDKVETGQASQEDVEFLIDNAEDCSPCFQSIEKQRLFITFLKDNLRQKGVPAELATSIRASVQRQVVAG